MQVDLMFAALLVLAVMALGLYFSVNLIARRLTPWVSESTSSTSRGDSR
jgi:putative hydroxymethylpyrimidine transport system permease protein